MDKISVEAVSVSDAKTSTGRNEIIAEVVLTVLGLAASFTITYFGVKWLVNAMDPTRKEKQEAHARVMSQSLATIRMFIIFVDLIYVCLSICSSL